MSTQKNPYWLTGKLEKVTYMISDLCLDTQHRHCETDGCECHCHRSWD